MKVFVVFGTRPEAIKLAPVVHKLKGHFDVKVVSSGQHEELLAKAIKLFRIEPDFELDCMKDMPDLDQLNCSIHEKMKKLMDAENPDLTIVQGDTLTTYTTSFVSFLHKKPVFHVEAGLRTYNKFAPYPEEILRTLVGKLADFHFAPTRRAANNLLNEGVRKDRILITGNTVVDALYMADSFIDESEVLKELTSYNKNIVNLMKGKKLVLLTVHRRESIGEPMKQICSAIKSLTKKYKDALFVLPVHMNPEVREIVLKQLKNEAGVVITEALSYQATIYLMKRSYIVMTDSGGIQEESPSFGKPVIVLRETTERPEVIEVGIGFLAGSRPKNITEIFSRLYEDKKFYEHVSKRKNPFGDGLAADRILKFLKSGEAQRFIKTYPESSNHCFKSENYKRITFTGDSGCA